MLIDPKIQTKVCLHTHAYKIRMVRKVLKCVLLSHTELETGKLTKETFCPLSMGGSWAVGSDVCLARIHNDRVIFASFNSLLRLLISAFKTSTSCRSFWFSWIASRAVFSSSSVFFLRISRDRLAATLFFRLLSQYFASFFSSGMGCLFLRGGCSMSSGLGRRSRFPELQGRESEVGGVRGRELLLSSLPELCRGSYGSSLPACGGTGRERGVGVSESKFLQCLITGALAM